MRSPGLLTLLLCFLLVGACGRSGPESPRPNVILIMTDDQGYGDFGSKGNPLLRTPNLDAMAARSAEMETFYVNPVCAPTRAALLTGRYNHRTRVIDTWNSGAMMEPDEVTIAEILAGEGYQTGIFGKWHLGDSYPMRPQDQGFHEVLVHRGGGIGQPADPAGGEGRYTDPILLHNGDLIQTAGFCTDVYFDFALDWMREKSDSGQPFFAYIATNAPHGPFHDVPEDLRVEYAEMDLSNDRFPQEEGQPLPLEHNQDERSRIYSMITNIDNNVGRLFEMLGSLDLTENTVVIFLTDNGPNRTRYVAGLRGRKGSVYEGGIRSPFWMHWPSRLAPGPASKEVSAHIDVLPTILDAVDIEIPDHLRLDGKSLMPLLSRNPALDWTERTLTIQSHRGNTPVRYHHFMTRDNRWKLVHHSGFGRQTFEDAPNFELFDLLADPFEERDVAADNPQVVERLKTEYDAWFDDVGSTRPDNYGPVAIGVGSPHETLTVLTRQDWRSIVSANWGQPEALGVWELNIARGATYQVRIIFPPSFRGGEIAVEIGDREYSGTAPVGAEEHTFSIELPSGPAQFLARLTGEVETGPWQVELTAL